ncbi:MAG TPA: MarR family winged helix-turn-helix transcriptional regulator [Pararobbsia sp.]|nr:MarR family winged helix-turn-helix transcriptional regulator [Pararobbsia sp.]
MDAIFRTPGDGEPLDEARSEPIREARTEPVDTDLLDDELLVEENYELALRRAARYVSQQYAQKLDKIGITPPQFTILRKIARHEGLLMEDLVEEVVTDRSTLVRAVQILRKGGFVTSEVVQPGRRNVFSLTPRGVACVARAREIWSEAQAEFEGRFGSERARRLRAELFGITRYQPTHDAL